MDDVVDRLLHVAPIESGVLKPRSGAIDLGRTAGECGATINLEAATKRPPGGLATPAPPVVAALDSARIKPVSDNLLNTAVKFSPPGST